MGLKIRVAYCPQDIFLVFLYNIKEAIMMAIKYCAIFSTRIPIKYVATQHDHKYFIFFSHNFDQKLNLRPTRLATSRWKKWQLFSWVKLTQEKNLRDLTSVPGSISFTFFLNCVWKPFKKPSNNVEIFCACSIGDMIDITERASGENSKVGPWI